mmetsp:Transcript_5798/g.11720  ORF Transcript_5798/g.11720 Transcript_5798/m.11720 type:complete len:231 (-) Transcript_5798:1252-1944(-)
MAGLHVRSEEARPGSEGHLGEVRRPGVRGLQDRDGGHPFTLRPDRDGEEEEGAEESGHGVQSSRVPHLLRGLLRLSVLDATNIRLVCLHAPRLPWTRAKPQRIQQRGEASVRRGRLLHDRQREAIQGLGRGTSDAERRLAWVAVQKLVRSQHPGHSLPGAQPHGGPAEELVPSPQSCGSRRRPRWRRERLPQHEQRHQRHQRHKRHECDHSTSGRFQLVCGVVGSGWVLP